MMGQPISILCICASLLIINVVNMQQSTEIKELKERVQMLEKTPSK